MKSRIVMTGLVLAGMMLLPFVSFAAPNYSSIDGYMRNVEWDGYQTKGNWDGTGNVGPGGGGQEYDVEKIGMYVDNNYLYLGLQTGFELNYGEGNDSPGDIAIDVGSDGNYEFAIRFSNDGSNSAFLGRNNAGTNNEFSAKLDIFSIKTDGTSSWEDPGFAVATPYKLIDGEDIGDSAKAVYTREGGTSYDPYRNTLEAAIDFRTISDRLAVLNQSIDGMTSMTIHWTMECGNDYLDHTFKYTPPGGGGTNTIPEPSTLLLFGFGLLGAGAIGRRNWVVSDAENS